MATIFKKGGEKYFSLEYIPDKTPYREKHINELYQYIVSEIDRGAFRPPILIGPSGTGKTTVINKTLRKIGKENPDIVTRNFNMMLVNSSYSAIRAICSFITPIPERGLSLNEIMEKLYGELEMEGKLYIIGLDDVDELVRREKGRILEILTRINEDYGEYRVFPIIVVRNAKPIYILPDHIKSKIGGLTIEFEPYRAKELTDIIDERLRKGLREGAITDNAVNVAAIISEKAYGGNAREMINLIYKSALYCERNGISRINAEIIRKIFFHEYYRHIKQDVRDRVKRILIQAIISSLEDDEYVLDEIKVNEIIKEVNLEYGYPTNELRKHLDELVIRGYFIKEDEKIIQAYLPKDTF